jgi:hypothetical protein
VEKDTYITEVIFRKDTTKDFKGTIFALMPYEIATRDGMVTSYQHIGQHISAEYFGCILVSKPATESEYADLKREMEGLGYNLKTIKKINYKRYLQALKQSKK